MSHPFAHEAFAVGVDGLGGAGVPPVVACCDHLWRSQARKMIVAAQQVYQAMSLCIFGDGGPSDGAVCHEGEDHFGLVFWGALDGEDGGDEQAECRLRFFGVLGVLGCGCFDWVGHGSSSFSWCSVGIGGTSICFPSGMHQDPFG